MCLYLPFYISFIISILLRVIDLMNANLIIPECKPVWLNAYERYPPRIHTPVREDENERGFYFKIRNVCYVEDKVKLYFFKLFIAFI